jgi:hypothetical protein
VIDDPHDLQAFGDAVVSLLGGRERATRLGENAKCRVARLFLVPRQLLDHFQLLSRLLP